MKRQQTVLLRRLAACVLLVPKFLLGGEPLLPEPLAEIDKEITAAIERKEIPGGVLWIEQDGQRYTKAYGNRQVDPVVKPMTMNTIFDLASLTKVVATTPAMMKVMEAGKVKLNAPVCTYIPAFKGEGREQITVHQLMTHTSGLPPGISRNPPWNGYETAIAKACVEPLKNPPGTKFVYSDINFILLGEIVRRTSGQRLDWFLRKAVFDPCGMTETYFRPGPNLKLRIAPTTREAAGLVQGVVHDPTSRLMNGIAGHAGCFSTAENLAKYARMLIAGGLSGSGKRILKAETIAEMTKVQTPPTMEEKRGLGWDLNTRYSEPRGEIFPPLTSFGHTGWTGTSIWISPQQKAFVILLTNRNHPTEQGKTKELRLKVSTLAAQAMGLKKPEVTGVQGPKGPGPVRNGIDVLAGEKFARLQGLRLGLITNHTGVSAEGVSTIDLLHQAPGVKLVALFSPEHGIRGQLDQANISDSKDEKTGLPVHSLYGKSRKPTQAQLAGLDALVFDIQDIGCRFYTYIATLKLCLEAADEAKLKVFVLDRVNPITGTAVDGPVVVGKTDFVGCHPISLRHGMTVGELAAMFLAESGWKTDLQVVKVEGWKRTQWLDQTELRWINPSPNMRSLTAAALYPGVGLLEFCNVSVGRGTEAPFEIFGAPWIQGARLADELTAAKLPGLRFEPLKFTPTASVFSGQVCEGVRIRLVDREKCVSVDLGLTLAASLRKLYGDKFEIDKMSRLLFHPPTLAALKEGRAVGEIRQAWTGEFRAFLKRREKYLFYPES